MSLEDLYAAWADGEPWAAELDELSRRRQEALPELTSLIDRFESGELAVAAFSRALDQLSKRRNLWGFRGYSGQMFLNTLLRAADHSRLEEELRDAIGVPANERDAEERLRLFSAFVAETRERGIQLDRYPPKIGYVPFFLSFFWEARSQEWPIYYPRSRSALVRHGLFREAGPLTQRYVLYRREILRLRSAFSTSTWGVEVFLFGVTADEDAASRAVRVLPRQPRRDSIGVYEDPLSTIEVGTAEPDRTPVELLIDELAATNERVSETRAEGVGAQRDLHAYLEALSIGVDTQAAPLPRFVELAVYVDEDVEASIENAVISLASVFGFIVVDEFPAIRRSFFRRWTVRSRRLFTKAELDDRLREVERAVQIRELDRPQADVDAAQAQAVADVVAAIEGYETASVRFGSIVVLKEGSDLRVRTLTPSEMHRISRDPTFFGFDDERPPNSPAQ